MYEQGPLLRTICVYCVAKLEIWIFWLLDTPKATYAKAKIIKHTQNTFIGRISTMSRPYQQRKGGSPRSVKNIMIQKVPTAK